MTNKIIDLDALDYYNDKAISLLQIQKTALPTASLTEEGNIYQYIGATESGLTNGYFYKCVENSGVYSWQAIDVQSGGGGSSVQSDWNQTDSTADDYIKNKPTIPDITGKADKVDGAVSGNFAGLDENGNLTDSGKTATDFATATDMSNVKGVIPSTATTSNKLATASDVADEEISATATNTSFSLTDATNGRLQGLTIEGRTTKTGDVISNVGDNGLVVTACGKNLIAVKTETKTSANIEFTANAETGTVTANNTSNNVAEYAFTITLEAGTYSLQGCPANGSLNTYTIQVKKDSASGTYICSDEGSGATFTLNEKTTVYIYIRIASGYTANNLVFRPQLELGSTATSFSPYKGSTASLTTGLPLCSVGDVKDEVDYNRGVVVKRTGKINLKTAEWTNDSQHANVGGFSLPLNNSNNGAISLILSSYPYDNTVSFSWFIYDTYTDQTAYKNSGNQTLYIKDTRYSTLEDFVAHFGNDDAVVYELAEPYEVPMTASEVTAYHALRTYEGTANITATDSPTMTVDYLLNTENGEAVAKVDEKVHSHTQASNSITAMTGYSKPASTSAIATTDTLNEAIGKLEKGLDDAAGGGTGGVKLLFDGSIPASSYSDISNIDVCEFYIFVYGGTYDSYSKHYSSASGGSTNRYYHRTYTITISRFELLNTTWYRSNSGQGYSNQYYGDKYLTSVGVVQIPKSSSGSLTAGIAKLDGYIDTLTTAMVPALRIGYNSSTVPYTEANGKVSKMHIQNEASYAQSLRIYGIPLIS